MSDLERFAGILADPGSPPIAIRDAAIAAELACDRASGMPSPRMQLTGQPMVDAWRVQAFAGALRAAIAEGARSVLAIEQDALPIALAL
ncbi:MAG: hypothetical protein KC656_09025, partial [Myxococcales bacterium]|nr:hypothetical protein [Myxococcales bacterium]